jgi:DNA (cytosine-5)-methyltransferase 1
MKFIELFSGIGGMSYGLEKAGFECVGFCENNNFAHKSFNLLHNSKKEMWEGWDIRNVTNEDVREIEYKKGRIDLVSAGFPCQSFSIVGQKRGLEDARGTLIFEVFRFVSILKPKYILLENVKTLLSNDKGKTFEIILSSMDELGYDVEWQVLNSKNFGVPQNRERVFVIGHLRESSGKKVFPIKGKSGGSIRVSGRINSIKGFDLLKRVYDSNHISPCLNTSEGGGKVPKIMIHPGKEVRKLTPLEYFRLQSFPDEWYYELKSNGISDSQLYKMAGNSVTSSVSYEIAKKIKEEE